MPALKIIKRSIDPITWRERVSLEFIPRIEDSVLDDQLAGSAQYAPPKSLPLPPSPPVDRDYRPPTPPKTREKGYHPNSPRRSLVSPEGARKSLEQNPGKFLSPRTRKKALELRNSLHKIAEDSEVSDSSLNVIEQLQNSLSKLMKKEVRFSDEVETNHISRMSNSILDEIFYGSEDLANFRYEAFMEEAGLDINDFD